MNQKIKKVIDEIERTKAKITELQILLPELERKRIDMENTEIIKLVRSAEILPAELPAFLESLKAPKASVSAVQRGSSHVAESEALVVSESAVIQQQNYHAPGDDHEQDDGDYSDDDYLDEDNDNGDSQSED